MERHWGIQEGSSKWKGRLCTWVQIFDQALQCPYVTFEPEQLSQISNTGDGLYDKTA